MFYAAQTRVYGQISCVFIMLPIGQLRVQDGPFSEKKGFIVRYKVLKMKKKIPPGFEPPIHGLRSKLSTAELFDLVTGHKISVYEVPINLFTSQSIIRTCPKILKYFSKKCCVKVTLMLKVLDQITLGK